MGCKEHSVRPHMTTTLRTVYQNTF